jgi:hypothetical protein
MAELAERARDGARVAREQVALKASEAAGALADEANRYVDERKGRAVDRVDRVASATHQTANILRAAKLGAASEYIEHAAVAMDGLTDYLEEGDVRQLLDDAADLARRHPAIAAAGVVVAGLAVGRFLAAGRLAEQSREATGGARVVAAAKKATGNGSLGHGSNSSVRPAAKRARVKSRKR